MSQGGRGRGGEGGRRWYGSVAPLPVRHIYPWIVTVFQGSTAGIERGEEAMVRSLCRRGLAQSCWPRRYPMPAVPAQQPHARLPVRYAVYPWIATGVWLAAPSNAGSVPLNYSGDPGVNVSCLTGRGALLVRSGCCEWLAEMGVPRSHGYLCPPGKRRLSVWCLV